MDSLGIMNWNIGDIKITLVREVLRQVNPTDFYPDSFEETAVDANRSWLEPHFWTKRVSSLCLFMHLCWNLKGKPSWLTHVLATARSQGLRC